MKQRTERTGRSATGAEVFKGVSMTVSEFIKTLKEMPDDAELSICGDALDNTDLITDYKLSWMDCSNGYLLFIEKDS
mgnify:CR=1 FL=1